MASNVADNGTLKALEDRLAGYNLRGQWQLDANRPQRVRKGPQNQVFIEPSSSGVGHLWQWDKVTPFLADSLATLTESHTARRTLIMNNPGLPRMGTTHTLVASIQIIGAGEIAWAHRHSINAFRFIIDGGPDVTTVVDGVALTMEPYDLILTPGWMWHDHHNRSSKPAVWFDGLDVPFVLALNQNFYEEFGEASQDLRADAPSASPFRYPWSETRPRLEAIAATGRIDPREGAVFHYAGPTGGPTMATLNCRVHLLPPGFDGLAYRRTTSAILFAVEGDGTATIEDKELTWGRHDTIAVPNWSWLRLANRSKSKPAILFSMDDSPIVKTFGFYRDETR